MRPVTKVEVLMGGHLGPYMSAGAVSVFGVTRLVSGYNGPLFRLVRASDSATLDVSCKPGSDLPNYNAIDAWIGASTVAVDIWYDQVGINNLTQTTGASRPIFANKPLLNSGGVRPIIFGGASAFPTTATKFTCTLNIPSSLSLDRNSLSAIAAVNCVSSYDKAAIIEFLTAGQSGTNQAVLFWSNGTPYSLSGSTSANSGIQPRAEPQFVCVTSFGASTFYISDDAPAAKGAQTSLTMNAGGNIGKSYVSSNFELRGEMFAIAFFGSALTTGSVGSARTVLTAKFSLHPSYSKRLVYGGSSLISSIGSTYNQSVARYMSLPGIEVCTCGRGGQTLANEYANRATVDYDFYLAGKTNVLVIDAPSNDIAALTPVSQADAETSATSIYNNSTLPYVSDAISSKGFHGVVVPTTIARGGFTTGNFLEYARLKYNQLVVAGAAGNGYVASDRAADSRLSNSSDLTYFYTDNIHLNDAGYAVMAGIDQAAITSAFN